MRHFTLTAVGADRPGIVAGVTGPLVGLDCNLEDTSMTILRGRFAMVMVLAGPDDLRAEVIDSAVRPAAEQLGLAVWVHSIEETVPATIEGESWAVSVHGADRPGIVHRVTSVLAESGVNICDLSTRVIGPESRPVYAMLLEVVLPPDVDGDVLRGRLEVLAAELGVACSMHQSGADIL